MYRKNSTYRLSTALANTGVLECISLGEGTIIISKVQAKFDDK